MYFADRLLSGRGDLGFSKRRDRHELVTCPPLWRDGATAQPGLSWRRKAHPRCEVLHESAPFAVVRWTNLYFPTRWGFLGDWFGGPLAPLFGPGVRDVAIAGNLPWRLLPAWAHCAYLRFPGDTSDGSVTMLLRRSLALETTRSTTPELQQDARP